LLFLKKGQVTFIAPLQPPTLAPFLSWGSSEGAGRKRLAPHKGNKHYLEIASFFLILETSWRLYIC
jgi:hypothetical protein